MPVDSKDALGKAIDRWENEGGAVRPADELTLVRRLVARWNKTVGEDLRFLKRERE